MKKIFILLNLVCIPIFAQEKINFIGHEDFGKKIQQLEQNGEFEKALELVNQIHPNDSIYCTSLTSKSYYLLNLDRIDEALEVTQQGLQLDCNKQSKMYFYVNTGYAYSQQKKYKEGIELYENAIKEFPKSASLWYNKGVIYKESEQLEKAAECFIKAIKYKPTYANAHYNLGEIIYKQEESSLGLMALSMSIFSVPDQESSLNKLSILNETLTTKNPNKATHKNIDSDQTKFKQLDLILDNLVAVDDNYQVDNKIPIPLVKQMHVFFEQIDNYKGNGGFWDQAYIPFFKWIKEKDYFDEFIYLLLVSNTNEDFQKTIEKEKKNIIAFAEEAFPKWYEIIQQLNTEVEEKDSLKAIYTYDEGHVHGVGLAKDGNSVGNWIFYSTSGYKVSEGDYNTESERTGLWQFFSEKGKLREENNYINGEEQVKVIRYYENLLKEYEYQLKNDEAHGKYKSYTYYGALKQEKDFVDGKLEGEFAGYFDTGKTHREFDATYKNGELEGKLIEYYSNGEIYSTMEYKNGVQTGKEIRYAKNGQKSFEVDVVDDAASGNYITYHLNGEIAEKGMLEDGDAVGKWQTFDRDGKLLSTFNYNKKGELDGEYIIYVDEKKQIEYTYKKDEIVAYTCYNASGEEIISKKKKKGKFYFKSFYLNGNLSNEGEYSVKGGKTGVWKEYYPSGVLKEKGTFEENTQVGEYKYYHENGEVSHIINFNKQGEQDGYATYFYNNGQMRLQGWYDNGEEVGLWEAYYKDGTLQSQSFYHKGKINGARKFYDVDAKLSSVENYTNSLVNFIEYYDKDQNIYDKVDFLNQDENYTIQFKGVNYDKEVESEYINGIKNGKYEKFDLDGELLITGNYLVGEQHGDWVWYKNGKIKTEGNYQFGDLHGKLTSYTEDGKVDYIEFYEYGNREGEWKNYHSNGEVSVIEHFENNNLHGKKSLFSPEGNLQINLFYNRDRLIGYSYLDQDNNEIPQIEVVNETADIVAYYPNGNTSQEFTIKNGLFEGAFIVYYENGEIRYTLDYVNGLRDGKREKFYNGGQKQESISFMQDDLHGELKTYHKNGEVKSVINYKLDRKHGEALYYNENGKLTKKELYYDDEIYERETY